MKHQYKQGFAETNPHYNRMKLEIKVLSLLDGQHQEELEDRLKEFIRGYGVRARIYSSTGNEMSVNQNDYKEKRK
ncbi:MAG: hypothetical protein WC614_07075 [bacterium]